MAGNDLTKLADQIWQTAEEIDARMDAVFGRANHAISSDASPGEGWTQRVRAVLLRARPKTPPESEDEALLQILLEIRSDYDALTERIAEARAVSEEWEKKAIAAVRAGDDELASQSLLHPMRSFAVCNGRSCGRFLNR